jgi:NADPH-dependent stearoyl-CoA 9-desaturase
MWQSFWTIAKPALPDKSLSRTSDDAPETRSEKKFSGKTRPESNGRRYGLRTALKAHGRVAA